MTIENAVKEATALIRDAAADLKKLKIKDASLERDRNNSVKACEKAITQLASLPRDSTREQVTKTLDQTCYPLELHVARVQESAQMILACYDQKTGKKRHSDVVERSAADLAHIADLAKQSEPIIKKMNKAIATLEATTGRLG